jgi:hypothetical protein
VKLSRFSERRILLSVNLQREGRSVAIHTEEDALRFTQTGCNIPPREQDHMQGLARGEALVSPHRNEETLFTIDCSMQPFGILPPVGRVAPR